MAWRRTRTSERTQPRASRHGRHGREGRSPVVRPPLPPLDTRVDRFDLSVGTAAEFLRSAWPELRDVRFEVADMPAATDDDGIPRWTVLPDAGRIILYRLPIERLSHLHRDDEHAPVQLVEGAVFRAAAEYLDRDPWDLGPERFRYF